MNLRELAHVIAAARDPQDTWCSEEKAEALAMCVAALRPQLVVEIGVWQGASLLPMLLALRHNGTGRAIAIDPWSPAVSVVGEVAANVEWWSRADHDVAFRKFGARMETLGVAHLCEVWRKPSDDGAPPEGIGLLHVDGSHTEQAVRDVNRFAANVRVGGMLMLDDCNWSGGGVLRAHERAIELGFVDLYPLGTGCVMQRLRNGLPA